MILKRSFYFKKIEKFFLIISLSSVIYIWRFNFNNNYKFLWVLPLSYFIIKLFYFLISNKFNNYIPNIIRMLSEGVIFIRYVVTPISMVLTKTYSGMRFGPEPRVESINYALILMILELAFVYFTFLLASTFVSNKNKILLTTENSNMFFFKNNLMVTIFIIVFLPIVFLVDPSKLIPDIGILINESSNTLNSMLSIEIPGFPIISNAISISIFLLLFSIFANRYNQSNNKLYILFSILLIIYYLGTIINSTRWMILFSLINIIIIFSQLYPKTPKLIYWVFGIIPVIGFITISIDKFSWTLVNSTNPYIDVTRVISEQFQEYFSGPRPVAQSIEMSNMYSNQITIETLFNDFFGSVPGIANVIDQTDRINVYYNKYLSIGNVTQIVPMLGIGYTYFPIFPMIFSCIFAWLTVVFDNQYTKTTRIEFKYIYGFAGFFIAMFLGFNTQIIIGNILTNFIPLYLLYSVNNNIKLKRQKPHEKRLKINR